LDLPFARGIGLEMDTSEVRERQSNIMIEISLDWSSARRVLKTAARFDASRSRKPSLVGTRGKRGGDDLPRCMGSYTRINSSEDQTANESLY
jgi:hypothetical protein